MAERITGHTELIGLMAYPIRHSKSPAMQNAAFAKLGKDYAYLAFEVDAGEIEDAVKAIRTLKMRGSNVSMPNKTLVGQYLDELSPAAKLCGAVNTIVNDNGYLTGHITDGIGFMQALKDNDIDVIGKKMTIVGCGGAGTGVGMHPLEDLSIVPDKSYFRPDLIVVDIPYSPLCTKMRKMAKEVGCKTMNGLGMMLFQGSAAFELWTGEPMPIDYMKEILDINYDD